MTTPIRHDLSPNIRTGSGGAPTRNGRSGTQQDPSGPQREQRVQRETEAATWAPMTASHRANPGRTYGPQGKWMP